MIRFRPLPVPTLWFLPGLLLLIGLGVWQIERLHEKEALIAAVNARIHAAPVPVQDALKLPREEAEWRHVRAQGKALPGSVAFLYAAGPRGEPGVQIITPLVLADGRAVLVNHGFVPDRLKNDAGMIEAVEQGAPVTGILRFSVRPGLFTPNPDVKQKLWFSKDAEAMGKALGVDRLQPAFVEADAGRDAAYPIGGQTIVDFPNDHLQYAITWFGLALALTGVYLVYHWSKGRLVLA